MTIALVLGGANTLAADREEAEALIGTRPRIIIACNHAARDEPGPVDHFATMHPDLFKLWLPARAAAGRPAPGRLWYAKHRIGPPEATAIESWGGSSGLLCVAVAFHLGVDRIILAGVPLHQNACHYDSRNKWQEASQYRSAWEKRLGQMRDRVRSLSGWTMGLLGAPTGEWVDAANVD